MWCFSRAVAFQRAACGGLAGRRPCALPPPCRRQQQSKAAGERLFSKGQPAASADGAVSSGRPNRETRSKPYLAATAVGVGVCIFGYVCYRSSSNDQTARGLNGESFAPFVVVGREPVSPTAVVLTLQPGRMMSPAAREVTRTAIAEAWRRGSTWAVEAKQPQLQIAREYTPLPPREADNIDTVRLFVRVVPGGEMSKYLVQRAVGDTVGLRGPQLGLDVARRLSPDGGRVLFLAAGTGIAPALQAASAALRTDDTNKRNSSTSVTILWANRMRQDGDGSPIMRDLQAMQQQYGHDRLQVHCFADEDRSFITEAAVRESLGSPGERTSWWPWKQQQGNEKASGTTETTFVPATSCQFHSTTALQRPVPGDRPNVLLVSGPDGFVSSWAGPKRWAGGQERQGPLGGVLGALKMRCAPVLDSWLVLKL
ncbi:cytochrome c mitochondrial import factor [Grosmannia clavigera kw1407]|uniref:Cytochrome c mitochondrial import factor n=1 Tax=Grosmannia clavigera (strain kw1407 / UAMH 11150) TaxID=655863 RepID=F0XCZ1_GROCL|nr:cytochrome c mitochondrial import factor [Grosmannia clavigera kw1407]EFX04826.1 cytochrome c mitochondrial import factor [Grosmannia clavigera kw1407]